MKHQLRGFHSGQERNHFHLAFQREIPREIFMSAKFSITEIKSTWAKPRPKILTVSKVFSDRPENHDDKRSDGNVSTVVTITMPELVNTVCNYGAGNLSSCRDKWKRYTTRGFLIRQQVYRYTSRVCICSLTQRCRARVSI